MRSIVTLYFVLGLATIAFAKQPKEYERGKLLQMDSVPCSVGQKDATSSASEMPGTHSGSKKTPEVLCHEYVLQTEHVIYHVRPRSEKHSVLLTISGDAQFRLEKDKMLLRTDFDHKEREYSVVSMRPRSDGSTADAEPTRLNHLQ